MKFRIKPRVIDWFHDSDKLGTGEACGTDDMAVSEVRHTAVTNSKNSVFKIAFIEIKPHKHNMI